MMAEKSVQWQLKKSSVDVWNLIINNVFIVMIYVSESIIIKEFGTIRRALEMITRRDSILKLINSRFDRHSFCTAMK
jgi:hypothetical protein